METGGYGQASYKFNDQFKVAGNVRYSCRRQVRLRNLAYVDFSSSILDTPIAPQAASRFTRCWRRHAVVDVTAALDLPDRHAGDGRQSAELLHRTAGAGVKSAGVILPNGFVQRQLGINSDAVTGGADIEWTPTPDIFTYARYGRGYESPSFNAGHDHRRAGGALRVS